MRRGLLLIIIMVASCTVTFAQGDNSKKYSASTKLFLSEQRGEIQLPKLNDRRQVELGALNKNLSVSLKADPFLQKGITRTIAEAEMVNGVKMVSAFIGVKDNDFSGLESLGVIFDAKFKNLATTAIPVDKIEKVAALDNVTRIEVAEVLQPANDAQRAMTKAYDAITNSSAAKSYGLTSPYTGKGVVLGVIDSGIDFQHPAFKDKNGKSRIKRAYTSGAASIFGFINTWSSEADINSLTTDNENGDHGTHTSSTAGGSSVIVTDNEVTVTDDHAHATFGGMAPEADLVFCGLRYLYTTAISTAIQRIFEYADELKEPCVLSMSLGTSAGTHDGNGSLADVINQYAGKNHIIVYAASNEAMRTDYFVQAGTTQGGGMYASGTSTNAKPMIVNLQRAFTNADGNTMLISPSITVYARTPNVETAVKFHIVDVNTGEILYTSDEYTADATINLTNSTGIAEYFSASSGTISLTHSTSANNKDGWTITAPNLRSTSAVINEDNMYESSYIFCLSVYPTNANASTTIDMWETGYCWFGVDLNLANGDDFNYCKGNDDCSISDQACNSNVISIGAYVSKNQITDFDGTTFDDSEDYPNIGDHAYFSSWQAVGCGPLGTALPTVSAPGARIVAAINHYHTASVDNSSYWNDFINDLVVNNSEAPYGAMQGTSMSTPCASGIIAQWLQACVEAGKTPTPNYIKEVIAATWDTDQWTDGTGIGAHGAKTFGTHGKINAIAGLQYILGTEKVPSIVADKEILSFESVINAPVSQTLHVSGVLLENDIAVTLDSESDVFEIDQNVVTVAEQANGKDITVNFNPTAVGTYTGTITLTSPNVETVTVQLNATATKNYPPTFDVAINEYGLTTLYLDFPVQIPYDEYPYDLLGVYYITEVYGNQLRAARLSEDIPANTGVIVQGNAGRVFTFPRIKNATPLKYNSILSGSIEDITPEAALAEAGSNGVIYTLGKGSDSYINFYQFTGSTLLANKAFLILEENGAKEFALNFDGAATGIKLLDADTDSESWYTVEGIRLQGKPTRKGLYIHNGKSVTIK